MYYEVFCNYGKCSSSDCKNTIDRETALENARQHRAITGHVVFVYEVKKIFVAQFDKSTDPVTVVQP